MPLYLEERHFPNSILLVHSIDSFARRLKALRDSQHTQRTLSLQPLTIWSCISSLNFSANDVRYSTWFTWHHSLHWPYFGDWKSMEEHLHNLETMLQHLKQAGFPLKRENCSVMLSFVEYLGYKISENGLQPTDEKITTIKNAPVPKNVSQLKSFLRFINYYSTFQPNLSHALSPLYRLLHKITVVLRTRTTEVLWKGPVYAHF